MEFSHYAMNGRQSGQKGGSRMDERYIERIAEKHSDGLTGRELSFYTITNAMKSAIKEAIAELEKPVEDDVIVLAEKCLTIYEHESTEAACIRRISSLLQQYAESYHAKKCAEVLSSAADRAMAVYARDCEGCSPRLSDDCDERCPYIAKIRKAIMEVPRA